MFEHGAVKVCLVLRVGGSAEAGVGVGEIEVREDLGGILTQELLEQVCGLLIVLELELALAQAEKGWDVVGLDLKDGLKDGRCVLPLPSLT